MEPSRIRYGVLVAVLGLAIAACAQEEPPKTKAEETLSAAMWELAAGAEAAADYRTAASHYERLRTSQPDSKEALLGYARNLRYLGLPKEAMKELQTGMARHEEVADLKVEFGKSQVAAAMLNDAKETFEELISGGVERWDVYSSLGIVYDRLGQYEKARMTYGKALNVSPGNIAVQNNLALSLAQVGRIDEAVEILERIVASEFTTPQSRQNLSLLYGMKGEVEKAEKLARQDLPPDLVQNNLATFHALHLPETANRPKPDSAPTASMRIPKSAPESRPEPVSKPSSAHRAGSPAPTAERETAAPRPRAQPIYISVGQANVRNGPTTGSAPVAFLKKNDRVRVMGKSSNEKWYYIALEDGRKGYVYHNLIRRPKTR